MSHWIKWFQTAIRVSLTEMKRLCLVSVVLLRGAEEARTNRSWIDHGDEDELQLTRELWRRKQMMMKRWNRETTNRKWQLHPGPSSVKLLLLFLWGEEVSGKCFTSEFYSCSCLSLYLLHKLNIFTGISLKFFKLSNKICQWVQECVLFKEKISFILVRRKIS